MYIQGKFKQYNDDISDVLMIREKVFVEEQKIPKELEFDEYDKDAIFCVVFESNIQQEREKKNTVATGRIIRLENGSFKIGRIAVLKEYRGQQYGDMVVKMLVNKAFMSGADKVYVSAQTQAVGFYQKIGFLPFSSIYQEAGIDHIDMVLEQKNLCTKCGHNTII